MSALADRLRKAKLSTVKAGEFEFTIQRPSHLQIINLQRDAGGLNLESSLQFVVGWSLKENDIDPGGSADPLPFDAEAFSIWVEDHPDVWADLIGGIADAYKKHADKLEGDAKN